MKRAHTSRSRVVAPRVLGIMSGTSLDGVDYAVCAVTPSGVVLEASWQVPYPRGLRERLHRAARGDATSWETGQLHHDLGRFYAAGALKVIPRHRPAVVGLHGQTIFHQPGPGRPATLQIGEPAWLVEALGVPVVANFRAGDLAAGGQGAPLVTRFHAAVFARRGEHVCINNLGGISNVTSLDWRTGPTPAVLAFDTGPANVLIDLAMRRLTEGALGCDRNGRRARAGRICQPLLACWLKDAHIRKPPPKSTGRERFGEPFLGRAWTEFDRLELTEADRLATLTEFTAASIAENYRRHLPGPASRVILHGGGAENGFLRERLTAHLREWSPGVGVETTAELGWPSQSIEPAAFGMLSWWRWTGEAGNLPATTGARHPALLGQVSLPWVPGIKNVQKGQKNALCYDAHDKVN